MKPGKIDIDQTIQPKNVNQKTASARCSAVAFRLFPTRSPAGRRAGSLSWAGAANTYFWIDPAINLAAVILTQILPSGDAGALKTLIRFERAVYAAMR